MSGDVHGLGIGKSDEWYTPPCVFAALGETFDLDVAAPVDGPMHVPAAAWISADSLNEPWRGFVWMNPPFGGRNGLDKWLGKFFDHGNGIALTPDRASAPWFFAAWQRADALMFTRRTKFVLPNGKTAGSPAFGNALWAAGDRAVIALRHAERNGFGLLADLRVGRVSSRASTLFCERAA